MSILKNLPPSDALSLSSLQTSQSLQGIKISAPPSVFIPNAPSTGIINNVVVFIRFKGEAEFTTPLTTYTTLFNNSTPNYNSLYNYFQQISYNTLAITSYFFPTSSTTLVVSYEDAQLRGYYEPYSPTNTIGYQGGNDGAERTAREQTLIANATNFVKPQIDATSLNLDTDADGFVDNICYIIKGTPGDWNTILWPHQWNLFTQTVILRGAKVGVYNVQIESMVNTGVLCHEMLHSIGFTDLYHYNFDTLNPIGIWDIMAANTNPPQNTSAYMKFRYSKWIASIPEISSPGTYTLNPLSSATNNCYKITSPLSTTEYFVVEYRQKGSLLDSTLPGSGLLVYRVNTTLSGKGNAGGPPDELYVFRPGGTLTSPGDINNAYLTSDVGRTSIGGTSNPLFFSNGINSNIVLTNITSAGNTISFTLQGASTDQADLSITKSASPNPIAAGQKIIYTLLVSNAGPSTAQNVSLSDTLPPELISAEYSTDNGVTWKAWNGAYSIGTLTAAASINILIRATVLSTATGTITNSSSVSSTTPDPNPSNNTSTSIVTILPPDLPADLRILKFSNHHLITVGQIITYKVQIQNLGPGTAKGIILTDQLPPEIINAEYSIDGGNSWYAWSGGYTVGDLSISDYVEILIRGKLIQTRKKHLKNTAAVQSSTLDPDLSNNSSSVTVTIIKSCPAKDYDCCDDCCDDCYDDCYDCYDC